MESEFLSLKWGTLKSWKLNDGRAFELLKKWHALGSCSSAMCQKDTPEQKTLICELIDAVDCEQIYLDWDDKYVSKEEAKRYVMEYGAAKQE